MPIEYPNTFNLNIDSLPEKISYDVVVVGSGAGGGMAAEILARSGLKVLIVEEGPLRTAKDFKMREKDAYAELYQEVAARQTMDKSIQILQGRCVGGSTTINWTSSFRTPEQTLDFWRQEFSLKGFSRHELAPWFEWAEKRFNITPWAVSPNPNNQLLAKGAEKLGWSSHVIPRNVKGCANLGYCGTGCPINAKQSMLVTCIPSALNLGATLIARARVERLEVVGDSIKGAWLSQMDSKGQVAQKEAVLVKAKHVVISAGAIGSPAILLRSDLQNISPLVGHRTFLHPVTASIAKMPQKVTAYQGAPQSIYSDQFLWRDGVRGEMGYKIEVPPLHPVLAATLLRRHGSEHFRLMQDFAYYQANIGLLRDGFHPESQGGRVNMDQFGYPQLQYDTNDLLWRGLKHAMLSMVEAQFAAGAENVYPLHMNAQSYKSWSQAQSAIKDLPQAILRWQIMSAHVMGGCGFGGDNTASVCGANGEIKGLTGVSVMDGSLFPTSLGVNPQLSIYAIVAKLASQLAVRLKAELPADLAELAQ